MLKIDAQERSNVRVIVKDVAKYTICDPRWLMWHMAVMCVQQVKLPSVVWLTGPCYSSFEVLGCPMQVKLPCEVWLTRLCYSSFEVLGCPMHSSEKIQSSPLYVLDFCLCDKVYHKQEVCFLFVFTRSEGHLTIITLIHWIKIDHAWL